MTKEPKLRDVVQHKTAKLIGTVITKYPSPYTNKEYLLDVEVDGRIYWATPAKNWDVKREATEDE